ncbi:MAG: GAF domain-containing protein [Chloroflexi bacterium]|nr:GAF domain-containing protein [Chloroflexota bacterium]
MGSEPALSTARREILLDLAGLVIGRRSLAAVFEQFARRLLELASFDWASLTVVDASGQHLQVVGSYPAWTTPPNGTRGFTLEEAGLSGLAMAPGGVEFIPRHAPGHVSRLLAEGGIERAWVIALVEDGKLLGALTIGRLKNEPFSAEETAFLQTAAGWIASAARQEAQLAAAERDVAEQKVIADVAAAAARESSVLALVRALHRPLRTIVPGPVVALGYLEDGEVVYPNPRGPDIRVTPREHELAALKHGQVAAVEAPSDGTTPLMTAMGIHAISLTAARSGGGDIGFVLIGSTQAGFAFSDRELQLFQVLARILGPAMENIRNAQRTARESALYDLLLRTLSDAVILLDRDFVRVYANECGEQIVQALAPTWQRAASGDTEGALPELARAAYSSAVREGKTVPGRSDILIDGEQRWMDFEMVPLDHPSYRLLVVATDVTEVVRHEAERERSREEVERSARLAALGAMISGVAHELNNPLTAILGFSELLESSPAIGGLSEEAGIIRREALRARDIVRDLLFIARPPEGARSTVDFGDIFAYVERVRRPEWLKLGIDVSFAVAAEGTIVEADPQQLTQVLLNLVTNAERAVRGVASPRITVREVAGGFEVEDNGKGMDATVQARIFEPFFSTGKDRGTGLGLSISHTIVTAHAGHIEVSSKPGEGARFRVTFPVCHSGVAATGSSPEPRGASLRVLVVDDEAAIRLVAQRLLRSLGHECDAAATSAEAAALAAGGSYDAVFCDYRLLGETGVDVVDALAAVSPGIVPSIVLCTGDATPPDVQALVAAHSLRVMVKPFGREDIEAVLSEVVRR